MYIISYSARFNLSLLGTGPSSIRRGTGQSTTLDKCEAVFRCLSKTWRVLLDRSDSFQCRFPHDVLKENNRSTSFNHVEKLYCNNIL